MHTRPTVVQARQTAADVAVLLGHEPANSQTDGVSMTNFSSSVHKALPSAFQGWRCFCAPECSKETRKELSQQPPRTIGS